VTLTERLSRDFEAEGKLEGSRNAQLIKSKVLERLEGRASRIGSLYELNEDELNEEVFRAIGSVLSESVVHFNDLERGQLVQEICDELLGSSLLEPLLRNPEISDILVARFDQIYLERSGQLELTDLRFSSEAELRAVIDRMASRVGRRIDEASPMVDARLSDGSRINAVVPPISVDGSTLSIRKFTHERLTDSDLVRLETISQQALDFLKACIEARVNIVISGGTGSGKTTTLNALSRFIPETQRIVTIEDTAELQLDQKHLVRLEARPANAEQAGEVTIGNLVRNALRMRPDRIVIGEVRDHAALDLLQAMNTGHDGSLTTVHANSAADALSRIETMALMAPIQLPIEAIRDQVARAIDLVVHQDRLADGTRRVTQIVSVGSAPRRANGQIETKTLFSMKKKLQPTGEVPHFLDRFELAGLKVQSGWLKVAKK
jgi:pilus assembly protein CpaF